MTGDSLAPWRDLCVVREDILDEKKFDLSEFAADLYATRTGDASEFYKDPKLFFSRTYPTLPMKKLVKKVLLRLNGEGGNPINTIQVTYGGGKTHTLIALLHLVENYQDILDLDCVQEFLNYANITDLPRARVVILPLDKFDVLKGMEVYGPNGKKRSVKTIWGAIAYQLAGDAGYTKIKEHEERNQPPAEPIIQGLIEMQQNKDGLSTLFLIDETLIYCREAVLHDPKNQKRLKDFFQYLTQAIAKTPNTALVASLLSSKPTDDDKIGLDIVNDLTVIFGRLGEGEEVVGRNDVGEVLRRRLFDTLPEDSVKRAIIDEIHSRIQNIEVLNSTYANQETYDSLLRDYPFHPGIIDAFYHKWTQIPNFQRTRGALRIFAFALREAHSFDDSLIIGPRVFLGLENPISPAVLEMVDYFEGEEKGFWPQIIEGELKKVTTIKENFPTLINQEIEQAVISTFILSQPKGQKAKTPDLIFLTIHPNLDQIAFEKALDHWRGESWFLTDSTEFWQLSTVPNLNHMHIRAIQDLKEDTKKEELEKRIQTCKELQKADSEVKVHRLPQSPGDVPDTYFLHYLILGPDCAIDPEKNYIPEVVSNYFEFSSEEGNGRTNKNAIIAVVPEELKLSYLKRQIDEFLGWNRVIENEDYGLLEEYRQKEVIRKKKEVDKSITENISPIFSLMVTMNEDGQIVFDKLPSSSKKSNTFEKIKEILKDNDRLITDALNTALLLPNGDFNLWGENETRKRVIDLVSSFGQFYRLPKVLDPSKILNAIENAVEEGFFVTQVIRDDGSIKTYWREKVPIEILKKNETEILPFAYAKIESISPELLVPEKLPGLWPQEPDRILISNFLNYFDGINAPCFSTDEVLFNAILEAVESGILMVKLDNRAYYKEKIDLNLITQDVEVLLPIGKIPGAEITKEKLPQAWENSSANLKHIWDEISQSFGYLIPWNILQDAVNEALAKDYFILKEETQGWPCSPEECENVMFEIPQGPLPPPIEKNWYLIIKKHIQLTWDNQPILLMTAKEEIEKMETEIIPIKQFIESINKLIKEKLISLESGKQKLLQNADSLNEIIRLPKVSLFAESNLSLKNLQDLCEKMPEVKELTPLLDYAYRIVITAEGDEIPPEILEEINQKLEMIMKSLKFVRMG